MPREPIPPPPPPPSLPLSLSSLSTLPSAHSASLSFAFLQSGPSPSPRSRQPRVSVPGLQSRSPDHSGCARPGLGRAQRATRGVRGGESLCVSSFALQPCTRYISGLTGAVRQRVQWREEEATEDVREGQRHLRFWFLSVLAHAKRQMRVLRHTLSGGKPIMSGI